MQRRANQNPHYDLEKRLEFYIVQHYFNMIIRMGEYYHCMQDVSKWRYTNIVEEGSKHKSRLWFMEKTALSEVKHYFTKMIRVIEYSYRMEGVSN